MAADLDVVEFENRKKKLRADDEEESEWEVSEHSEDENNEDHDGDESYDSEDWEYDENGNVTTCDDC